jgi:myo-inositol-hexaphosphate 3-phosphohydrolase
MRRILLLLLIGILGLFAISKFGAAMLSAAIVSRKEAGHDAPEKIRASATSLMENPVQTQVWNTPTASPPRFESFGTVSIQPDFEVDGQGLNVDSIAFWEAPESADTLMFVTAKKNQLVEVWKYPFVENEQSPIQGIFKTGNVNGIVMDQRTDLLYVSQAKDSSTVFVFSISDSAPYWELKETFSGGSLGSEPNQDILYHANGETWLYVTDSEKGVQIWNVDPLLESVPPELKGDFTASDLTSLETILADDYYQVIYIPDENGRTGVFAYQPDGGLYQRNAVHKLQGNDIFQSDEEGIVLYTCSSTAEGDRGRGLIVVADQEKDQTDFEFFDRQTWAHLGTLRIEGVSNTDGIASTQQSLPDYPLGIFAAINDDETTVGVGWDRVLNATGLSCEPSSD